MRALLLVLLTAAETWVGTEATFRLNGAAKFYTGIGRHSWRWGVLRQPAGRPFWKAVWWCVGFELVLMLGVGLYADLPNFWNLLPIALGAAVGVAVYIHDYRGKRLRRRLRKLREIRRRKALRRVRYAG